MSIRKTSGDCASARQRAQLSTLDFASKLTTLSALDFAGKLAALGALSFTGQPTTASSVCNIREAFIAARAGSRFFSLEQQKAEPTPNLSDEIEP